MLVKNYLIQKFYINLNNTKKYANGFSSIEKFENFDPVNIDGFQKRSSKIHQQNKESKFFSMIMPPPNVTGNLHIGHALSFSLQDVIIRSKRMMGCNTVWIPGCDHAGIATQIQVEKYLQKIYGKSQSSTVVGREEFISHCNDWSAKRRLNISCQIKALGLDPNWELEFFTLDEKHSLVVSQAFIHLYNKQKIYRENRIINWCCRLQSTISDIEVDFKEINGETNINVPGYQKPIKFGIIYKVIYKFENNENELAVVTTRPETIPGDICLAVHPDDSRFSRYIGQRVKNPITDELMPIISDFEVKPDFGTGVVKITPGHSLIDFRIAKRHNLPIKNIFDNHGNMEKIVGINVEGVPRFIARDIIINYLNDKNLYQGCDKDHSMKLPFCSRSGDVIEHLIRPQWFYDVSESCDKAIQAIEKNEIKIQPNGYVGEFLNFFKAKEPWCISRQLKWGHKIPAYFYSEQDLSKHFIGASKKDIVQQFPFLDSTKLQQDPDVLDTWFSSSLLPLSLSGWPEKPNEFYPISLLVTGHDIVPLWVCRMMLISLEIINQLPFKDVLLHGMICDSYGEKMSKSRGNVIDPIQLIGTHFFEKLMSLSPCNVNSTNFQDFNYDSKKLSVSNIGSDAVRFSLLEHFVSGHQIRFSLDKAILARKFMQKMWQSVRFIYHRWTEKEISDKRCENLRSCWEMITQSKQKSFNHLHRFILYELAKLVSEGNLAQYQYIYHPLCIEVREFWWNTLCSVFIEWCKSETCSIQNQENLSLILLSINTCLHLIHPVVPQISECLWHSVLKEKVENKSLGNENYPSIDMVGDFLCSKFQISNSIVQKALNNVSEINFWTKSLKLSKTKLKFCDIIFLEKIDCDNEDIHEIISRLSGVRFLYDRSSETCFSMKINDSLKLVIDKQLCDLIGFESGLTSRLKQCVMKKNEILLRLEKLEEVEDYSKQLIQIEDQIKAFENQLNNLHYNKKEKVEN